MIIKSFGCSFIYGSDLKDCPHGVDDSNPPPSQLTWPALLANQLGLSYRCHARPAASNLQILETVLSSISDHEDAVYVVNWTWIERFGYTSDSAKTQGKHPWNPRGWCSILPSNQDQPAKLYYRYLHSQFRDKLESLICIKTAIDALTASRNKFLMTYTDNLIFENQWHTSAAISYLQNQIRSHLVHLEGKSFWDWIEQNQFEISDKGHPLEMAHEVLASAIKSKMTDML